MEEKPQQNWEQNRGTPSNYISLPDVPQINDARFDHQHILPKVQGFVRNETFWILTLHPKCLLPDPGGAAQQNEQNVSYS